MNILRVIFSLELATLISYLIMGLGALISYLSRSESGIPAIIGGVLGIIESFVGAFIIYRIMEGYEINYLKWSIILFVIHLPFGLMKQQILFGKKEEQENKEIRQRMEDSDKA